jgi:DNA-binding Xre family transcriptional regulator
MSDHPDRWPAVKARIAAAMADKGWGQADLIRASGVSDFTIRRLMNGEPGNYRASILGRVSKALWGDPQGITRILAGDEPSAGPDERDDDTDEVVIAIQRSPHLDPAGKRLILAAYRSIVVTADGVEHRERRGDDPT